MLWETPQINALTAHTPLYIPVNTPDTHQPAHMKLYTNNLVLTELSSIQCNFSILHDFTLKIMGQFYYFLLFWNVYILFIFYFSFSFNKYIKLNKENEKCYNPGFFTALFFFFCIQMCFHFSKVKSLMNVLCAQILTINLFSIFFF